MLRRNLVANYFGQGWAALMGLAFVPIYIKYLGIEAYGLIGFFLVLQAWLLLLDMGLTPTLSREMSRFTGGAGDAQSIHDLLRSVEVVGVVIAVSIALALWFTSAWLANDWLNAEGLQVVDAENAFVIMGFVIAVRFLEGIYRSSLVGLQRQVIFNLVYGLMATIRGSGAVIVLAFISPTIEAFFLWQLAVSIVSLLFLMVVSYACMPAGWRSGKFSSRALRGISIYAGGMLGISLLSLMLTQIDKILLSKMLTLSDYGYYTLSAVVASGLYILLAPITQSWFPRLSELYARGDEEALIKVYHQGSQLVSVVVGSAALIIIVYGDRVVQLWTQDSELVVATSSLVKLLVLGNLFNAFMTIPYQTQLASGWTSLTVRINLVAVLIIIPALLWVTPKYGAIGAAFVWMCLNLGYVLVGVQLMYLRILKQQKWVWYRDDLIKPASGAVIMAVLTYFLIPAAEHAVLEVLSLCMSGLLIVLAAALSSPEIRGSFLARMGIAVK